ncbi:hypothetical protein BDZ89DRAFT_1130769 [Hymenopellis radicata]|nr:hypothetical protein BDZ89DRAFT_1130769 [Hymenopellis radicata]
MPKRTRHTHSLLWETCYRNDVVITATLAGGTSTSGRMGFGEAEHPCISVMGVTSRIDLILSHADFFFTYVVQGNQLNSSKASMAMSSVFFAIRGKRTHKLLPSHWHPDR